MLKMSQVQRQQQESANERLTRQLQWCLQMFEDLQETSLAVNRDSVVTSSHDIMDIDWKLTRDDVIVNDDFTAKNLDNDRDSTQWKRSRKLLDNRKLSFGIFGRSDAKKDRDSAVVIREESVLDRRPPPKRFFSQQNLKAVPKDAEVCEGGYSSSRFHPSRFLWRFGSNQKIKSNSGENGGSSLSLNHQKVPVIEELPSEVDYQSPVERYPVDESVHHWLREDNYPDEAVWKGGMERRSRCQSLSVLPEASSTSVPDHHSSGSCCPQRSRPSVLGGEFCSTRCLGDYRPCLNTHYEEPTSGGGTGNQRPLMNDRTHQNWTMIQEGGGGEAGPADSYEIQMHEARQRFRASACDLDLTWSEGPDVRSKFNLLPEENGKPDVVATATNPAHFQFRSPLSANQQQIDRQSTITAIRNDAAIRDKTTPEQDSSSPLQDECHARTMRRLSKELYSEHSQSKTLPHSSAVSSPFKKPHHQTIGETNSKSTNFTTVGRTNGFTNLPTKSFSPSTRNPRDQFDETSRDPLGYFHSRSLSMSQLQGASPSNTSHQWSIRDGYNVGCNTRMVSGLSDSGDYDLIGEDRYSLSDFNAGTRPPSLPGGVCHQRGGSLDSNEAGRAAYERGSLAPASRRTHEAETKGGFSRPDTNRLGYNEDDNRHLPFRYDIYQPHNSDSELTLNAEKKNPVSATKQLQQQAMVNLFQKLSTLKQQQKQQQQLNGSSTSGSYEQARPSSSCKSSSQQVDSPLDKWKGLDHPTTRPCHPVLNLLNRNPDVSAKTADVRTDVSIVENHESASKIPSQQSLVTEYGQVLRKTKKQHYSEGILNSTRAGDVHPPPPPPPLHPTPLELPPKAAAAAARRPDVSAGPSSSSYSYVDRLRQEARKQTKSASVSGSLRSNSEPDRIGADDVRRRRHDDDGRRHSDGEELKKKADYTATTTHRQMASFNNNNNNSNNRSTENDSSNDNAGRSLRGKSPVSCEYLRKDQSSGGIQNGFSIESHEKEIGDNATTILKRLTENTNKKQKTTTDADDNFVSDSSISNDKLFSHCVPGGTSPNAPNGFQTDGQNTTRCTDRCLSSLSDADNKESKTVEISTDSSSTPRRHFRSLSDILKDLPDEEEEEEEQEEEANSPEDEHFRSLSGVFYRHHPDACRILTPVCVRSGASFVRRILFEGQSSPPEFENSFQAIVDMRSKDDFKRGDGNGESRKDSTISGDSLQTIKDELLALVDERFQRQTEKTEQLTQLNVRTLLLENKVIEFVRGKIDSRQLEKFLSYLEQLEKVVQLFLNLSSRLSSVEETICQSQRGSSSGDDQREQKRYNDKRLQILLRLKEAMDLKSSIDARSEQVCAHLSRHLTPTEFDDFRTLVRNRCQLLIQKQAIEDRKQLIVLQRKFLADQSSQTSRAKTTCCSADDSNLIMEKNTYT